MPPEIETYLDHAASAPLLPESRAAIVRALDIGPGNASSSHAAGRRLRALLGDAREAVAALLSARPDQVVFTSGTTEANRLGVRGLLNAPGNAKQAARQGASGHPHPLQVRIRA